jgi:hypothetical protein
MSLMVSARFAQVSPKHLVPQLADGGLYLASAVTGRVELLGLGEKALRVAGATRRPRIGGSGGRILRRLGWKSSCGTPLAPAIQTPAPAALDDPIAEASHSPENASQGLPDRLE